MNRGSSGVVVWVPQVGVSVGEGVCLYVDISWVNVADDLSLVLSRRQEGVS